MLLVSGATATLRPRILERPDIYGTLVVPRDRNSLPEFGRWAADNGAFPSTANPGGFDEAAFLDMLARHQWAKDRCLFVTAPDVVRQTPTGVVGDHTATLALFDVWAPRLRAMGWPVAFVAQDGCTAADVPFEGLAAVFIGGSTEFKLGRDAARIAAEAQDYGVWVHMGRVNSGRRLRYAAIIGCDSVDGSGWSKWPKAMLTRHGTLLRYLSEQRRMVYGALAEGS